MTLMSEHFENNAERDVYPDNLRTEIIGTVARTWARLVCVFSDWPWRLFSLPYLSRDEQESLCKAFFNAERCCLDVVFSMSIRDKLERWEDLLEYVPLFKEIALCGGVGNTTLENLLCQVKTASPRHRRPPGADRTVHAGPLCQHMNRYLAHGYADSRRPLSLKKKRCARRCRGGKRNASSKNMH